jgi:hypothetical protein
MAHLKTVRDAAGQIAGFAAPGEQSQFAALLDDTMTATGAAAAPPTAEPAEPIRPQLGAHTYAQLAGALGIITLMIVAALLAFRSGAEPAPPVTTRATAPAEQPTVAPAAAQVDAYAAPDGALLGPIPADTPLHYRHSDFPEWAGVDWQGKVVWIKSEPAADLPDLRPRPPAAAAPAAAPAPQIIYVEPSPVPCDPQVNPLYSVQEDVYDGARPIGQVVGVSCESQADAQANADAAAAAMKKGKKP